LTGLYLAGSLNLVAGWAGLLLGALFGAGLGWRFHQVDWLGGYASWPRRMLRLGHVSFFGLGLLNIAFALTVRALGLTQGLFWPAALLLVGAATMPAVCYLAAFHPAWQRLFIVPVASVTLALGLFLWRVWLS
jgi:hypothetical protein